jgi:hypothetical protein
MLAPKQSTMWKWFRCLLGIVAGVLLHPVAPASASDVCRLSPWIETGQSGVLGFYYGGGFECRTDHLVLTLGARATNFGNNVLQPVAVLTYTTPLRDSLAVSLKTSLRERIGDYEVNALPEFSLSWNPPPHGRDVQLSAAATWGSYAATTVASIIQRTQVTVTASWPTWRPWPAVDARFGLTGAYDAYSTGDTQSWLQADFSMGGPLSRSADWFWGIADRNGTGVSPLKFDGNSGDAWTSAGITFHLDSRWDVSVRGTYNFYSATMSNLQLEVRTTAFTNSPITFTYDATGGTLTGAYDLPNLGNIGLRYDQYRPAFYVFFQPH